MKVKITETVVEANAQELRESQTLTQNFAGFLSRLFKSTESFGDEDVDQDPDREGEE